MEDESSGDALIANLWAVHQHLPNDLDQSNALASMIDAFEAAHANNRPKHSMEYNFERYYG